MQANIKQLYEATDNLINQQFYLNGRDLVIGRTPDISIKIANSGQVIKKFKDLFNKNILLFLEGDFKKFLSSFKKIKGIDDKILEEIHQVLKQKLTHIENMEINVVVLYTIVLSSIISRIRDIHFNSSIREIRKRVKLKSDITDNEIQDVLDQLFMKNNRYVSLLYNLSYFCALSASFNYKKVSRVCKIQRSKYINYIVNIILSQVNK